MVEVGADHLLFDTCFKKSVVAPIVGTAYNEKLVLLASRCSFQTVFHILVCAVLASAEPQSVRCSSQSISDWKILFNGL
jgi:hypothetical protein